MATVFWPGRNLRIRSKKMVRMRRVVLAPLLLLIPLLCSCHAWNTHKTLIQVRDEIQATDGPEMEKSVLYHLTAAKGLLADAEKQYEDADFPAALKFARRAREQLDRARKLQDFHKHAGSLKTGGDP